MDRVVRGEAEYAFPALLEHMEEGTPPTDVPGLCWWDGHGSRANTETRRTVAPAGIPAPDYDQWQAALDASPVQEYVHPKLVAEGARGCWWGEKHHCALCGFNGSAMAFRAKPGERLWQEIDRLVRRHRLLDVVTVDNIIDMAYFRDLLPRVAESGWDLRLHYEVKSNLTPGQLRLLGESGTVHIQPGIESPGSRVLDLMDEGVTGARNVRTLRECENHAPTCSWNLLHGFPGETADDYTPVIDQLPALVHLQPPSGAHRIQLERFSPHFTDPALGFGKRCPAETYQRVHDLPEGELADLVYLFDTEDAGIRGPVEQRLRGAPAAWRAGHADSRLLFEESGEELLVVDRRHGRPPATHRFTGRRRPCASWRAAAAPPPCTGCWHNAAMTCRTGREAVGLLAAERPALVGGGWAVALPPRIRRRPVPCTAIRPAAQAGGSRCSHVPTRGSGRPGPVSASPAAGFRPAGAAVRTRRPGRSVPR
ncbi:RiPP maturation radical SAM C-methyltransferase [Streptomyces sp. NPDC020362]|uniref:RiPP maturation radical SAM C-methyltransferase n=1 Tax=Streptomyces sp. NPDC020362 TaxID=3154486 RepID=UPI0033D4A7A9